MSNALNVKYIEFPTGRIMKSGLFEVAKVSLLRNVLKRDQIFKNLLLRTTKREGISRRSGVERKSGSGHPIRTHVLSESDYGLCTVSLDAKRRRSRI